MGLSAGRKSVRIGLAVLIQYRSVTATQPPSHSASHVAVAITLYAIASSLKTYKHYVSAPTAGARCTIFPKLCMMVELVEAIKKGVIHCSIQRIDLLQGTRKNWAIDRRVVSQQ